MLSCVVIVYCDAHGDLNVPVNSSSVYLGGMPKTAAIGCWEIVYDIGLEANLLGLEIKALSPKSTVEREHSYQALFDSLGSL